MYRTDQTAPGVQLQYPDRCTLVYRVLLFCKMTERLPPFISKRNITSRQCGSSSAMWRCRFIFGCGVSAKILFPRQRTKGENHEKSTYRAQKSLIPVIPTDSTKFTLGIYFFFSEFGETKMRYLVPGTWYVVSYQVCIFTYLYSYQVYFKYFRT